MKSKLLYHTVQTLNEVAKTFDITIRWIKAHLDDSVQHRGNAFADASAKLGAIAADTESLVHPDDIPLMSLHSLKVKVHPYLVKRWDYRWVNNMYDQAKCKETKDWFPKSNAKLAFQLLSGRSRYEFSILIHAITGHNHLAYHESKQDSRVSPMCFICQQSGTLMTTKHLFTECDAFGLLRLRIFGTDKPSTPYTFSVNQAVLFLRESNVGWLPTNEG